MPDNKPGQATRNPVPRPRQHRQLAALVLFAFIRQQPRRLSDSAGRRQKIGLKPSRHHGIAQIGQADQCPRHLEQAQGQRAGRPTRRTRAARCARVTSTNGRNAPAQSQRASCRRRSCAISRSSAEVRPQQADYAAAVANAFCRAERAVSRKPALAEKTGAACRQDHWATSRRQAARKTRCCGSTPAIP